MTSAQRERRAVALSGFDVPGGQDLLLHGCEDCACSVSDTPGRPARPPLRPVSLADVSLADTRRWVRAREVVEMPLDPGHRLLFNPAGRGGVVVVNEPGREVFHRFGQPVTVGAARRGGHGGAEFAEVFARLRQFDLIHPVGQAPRPVFGSGEVLTAWLHVTNACNLRCPYCYVHKTNEPMDQPVGYAAVEAVVRAAAENGFPAVKLKYAGGEASLNHRLMLDIHRHAQALAAEAGTRLYATLLSNGVTLSPALVEDLKAAGIRVMVSLDGVGDRHDAQRPFVNGKPSFRFVERTIAQLIAQDHAPHLSITITNRNAGGLADVVRFALERDVTFSLNFFRDNECAASFGDLQYEEQTMITALRDAFGVVEEFLPRWSVLGSILDRGQLLQPRQRSCGVGQDYIVIDQRGRVAKCHMEIERTIGDVFSDDPLQLIRRDDTTVLNLAADEKEGCRDCTWRYWCSGGCSVATFKATGRYDIKSPNCNIYKAIYPEALKLEGLRLLKYAAPARSAVEPVGLDVPAGPGQQGVPRGGQAREVGHLPAGHEADAAAGRQPEQSEHPLGGDLLQHHRAG